MDSIVLQRLGFQCEMLEKRVERAEATLQDIYGALREVQGRLNSDATFRQLQERISEIQSIDMEQQIAIGQIQGAIAAIKDSVNRLVSQLQGDRDQGNWTINVQGGSGGQSHSLGDNANIDTMQTGSDAKVLKQ